MSGKEKIKRRIAELIKSRETIEVDPFMQWRLADYHKKFIETLNIQNATLNAVIKKKKITDWIYGSINRYPVSAAMSFSMMLDTVNTITVAYKIKDITKKDKEVIYNMAYLSVKAKDGITYTEQIERVHKGFFTMTENLVFRAICPSGSMVSKDGEYRSGMLNWNLFQVVINKEKRIKELFDYLISYFTKALRERKYILLLVYFFPNSGLKNRFSYEAEMICGDLKVQFFVIAWFKFYHAYVFGVVSNHINQTYQSLMLTYYKEDIRFFRSIFETFDINVIAQFRYLCSETVRGYNGQLHLHQKIKLGQKIIPLNLLEAQQHFNLDSGPWKEMLISFRLSDLVINNITNGFALCNSWFLIKSNSKELYDNPSQSERIDKSTVAVKITDTLNQAKILTHQNINMDDVQDSGEFIIDKSDITSWLSGEFRILKGKIQDSIDYSKENIIISNVSLGIISEYVGKTLYDAVFFTKNSKYYQKHVSGIFSKASYPYFRKWMFQMCYGLYCMNDKAAIIHGDLHLNNMTINSIFYNKQTNLTIDNPRIMYVLDSSTQYIFEHNYYDLCIIDFSRSIVDIDRHALLASEPISTVYPLVTNRKSFDRRQINALLTYLFSAKPEFKEYELQLFNLLSYHFGTFFKILTVLDIYNVTSKFMDFMEQLKSRATKPYIKSLELIINLNKSSEYFLTTVLMRVLEKRNYDEIEQMEWPMLTIIRDNFRDNLAENMPKSTYDSVIDIYNFENPLDYSISQLKKFPKIMVDKKKIGPDGKVIADSKESKLRSYAIKRRKLYEEQYINNFHVINVIMKRQVEKNR